MSKTVTQNQRLVTLLLGMLLAGTGLAPAQATSVVQFSSGPTQTLMLELYTSEGCSSCPPAEALLNSYVQEQELWTRFIPVALHVDYWDGLGWKDRYADPQNTARQQQYARLKAARTVYTPAFVANGEFWRAGLLSRALPAADKQVGTLDVRVEQGQINADFEPLIAQDAPLYLHAALLGMDLRSQIRAGENAGRAAEHQFVVLGLAHATNSGRHWQLPLPVPKLSAPRYALAVWVTQGDDPTPLQATGGHLPAILPVTGK